MVRPRGAIRHNGERVGGLAALTEDARHAVRKRCGIRFLKADGAHEPEIVHALRVGVCIHGLDHGGLRQAQAAEKAHAERHNGSDGQKAAEAFADLP